MAAKSLVPLKRHLSALGNFAAMHGGDIMSPPQNAARGNGKNRSYLHFFNAVLLASAPFTVLDFNLIERVETRRGN
jgi:hypothetical protein